MVSDAVLKSLLQFPENVKNKLLFFYLILSLYLLYIQAIERLGAVLQDLEKIKVKSEIDAYLYTADLNYPSHCNLSVIKCFQLEMQVVSYESKFVDPKFHYSVERIIRTVRSFLSTNTDSQTCQQCETYTEKKYSDFISGFKEVIQRINYEENKKMKIVH